MREFLWRIRMAPKDYRYGGLSAALRWIFRGIPADLTDEWDDLLEREGLSDPRSIYDTAYRQGWKDASTNRAALPPLDFARGDDGEYLTPEDTDKGWPIQ